MKSISRLGAALAIVSALGLLAPEAALASACTGGGAGPVYVAFCHDSNLDPGPGAVPQVRVFQPWYAPDAFGILLDVPDGGYVDSVAVRYSADGSANEVRIPVGLSRGSHCVFYVGPAFANPGNCLLALNRG